MINHDAVIAQQFFDQSMIEAFENESLYQIEDDWGWDSDMIEYGDDLWFDLDEEEEF